MLQKLLDEIQSGGTLETGVLAARLGTTPQMVKEMLAHLERLGRLQSLQTCSPQGCKGCGYSGTCSVERARAQVWQLTNPSPLPLSQRERD